MRVGPCSVRSRPAQRGTGSLSLSLLVWPVTGTAVIEMRICAHLCRRFAPWRGASPAGHPARGTRQGQPRVGQRVQLDANAENPVTKIDRNLTVWIGRRLSQPLSRCRLVLGRPTAVGGAAAAKAGSHRRRDRKAAVVLLVFLSSFRSPTAVAACGTFVCVSVCRMVGARWPPTVRTGAPF